MDEIRSIKTKNNIVINNIKICLNKRPYIDKEKDDFDVRGNGMSFEYPKKKTRHPRQKNIL